MLGYTLYVQFLGRRGELRKKCDVSGKYQALVALGVSGQSGVQSTAGTWNHKVLLGIK